MRDDATTIWQAGVAAVEPARLVRHAIAVENSRLRFRGLSGEVDCSLDKLSHVLVIGFGKAGLAMARGAEATLRDRLPSSIELSGQVNVAQQSPWAKEAQVAPGTSSTSDADVVPPLRFVVARHCRPPGENFPTPAVVAATKEMLDRISASPLKTTLVITLISGGGSALLELPRQGLSLEELRQTAAYLSQRGADIYQLNSVRRLISQVKGGGLAAAIGLRHSVSLILSDVVGDDVNVIASGPTVLPVPLDPSVSKPRLGDRPATAAEVLRHFDPNRRHISHRVWAAVENKTGELATTRNLAIENSHATGVGSQTTVDFTSSPHNLIIGNVETAMHAAAEKAAELGYQVDLDTPSGNQGESADVGRRIAGDLLRRICVLSSSAPAARPGSNQPPTCQISGGETTVNLSLIVAATQQDVCGRGGRNQHLVLATITRLLEQALETRKLAGLKRQLRQFDFCLISGGTDGEDGNVPVAGALVDNAWLRGVLSAEGVSIEQLHRRATQALNDFDSFRFLEPSGLVIQAQPTETNVGDLRILLKHG